MMISYSVWIVRFYCFCIGMDIVFQKPLLVPENPKVLEESTITLSCIPQGTSSASSTSWGTTYMKMFFILSFDEHTRQCSYTGRSQPYIVNVTCNRYIFNISISPVLNDMHGSKWTCSQGVDGSISSTSLYVEVPVKNVIMSSEGMQPEQQLSHVENESLTVECKSSFGRPPPSISWLIGESYSNATAVNAMEKQLQIYNASDDTYNCTWSNLTVIASRTFNNKRLFCNSTNLPDIAPVSSNYFTFDVHYPPTVEPIQNSSIIERNNCTKLCLTLDGNPANTTVTWTRGDNLVSTGKYLNISPVERNNEGYYTCSARNEMQYSNGSTVEGAGHKSFHLSVMYPPEEITVDLTKDKVTYLNITDKFNVTQGSLVTLGCNANSRPPPLSYTWGGMVSVNEENITIFVTKNHSGKLICTVRNIMIVIPGNIKTAGSSNKTYSMNVQFPPEIGDIQDITVVEFRKVSYKCPVTSGNPSETKYIWTRSGDNKVWKSEVLLIDPVSRNDQGFYSLSVTNVMKPIYGSEEQGVSNKTLYMTVLYPPEEIRVIYIVDNMKQGNITDTFSIMDGTNVTLSCSANSNPPPFNFSWSGNMTKVNKRNITLYVSKRHSGNYTCGANNLMTERPGNTTSTGSNYTTFHMEVLYPPVIEEMQNITIIERKNISIVCPVTRGNPSDTHFLWTREVSNKEWRTETLTIDVLSRNDEGIYTCTANNTMRATYGREEFGFSNKSLYLNVLYPPEALSVTYSADNMSHENISDTIKIIQWTYITLSCSARSKPPHISYVWSGNMAAYNKNISFNVTKRHIGEYVCSASNVMTEVPGNTSTGMDNKTYHIDVLYPPEINQMQNMTVIEGNSFNLNCSLVNGNPYETTIKWVRMKDNKAWYSETMSIGNITRSDDSTYTCIANNTLSPTYGDNRIGLSSRSVHIEILYKTSINHFVIEGYPTQNTVTLNESQHVNITCSVESNPKSFINITFDGKLLTGKNGTNKLVYSINKTKCTDFGTYICHGSNWLNNPNDTPNTYLIIFINCAPRQSSNGYTADNVTNVTSVQHVSTTMTFKALAYPKPSIQWYRKHNSSWIKFEIRSNGKLEIVSSPVVSEYSLTLFNISKEDYGQYRLDIYNLFGNHSQLFNLIPKDKPNPPLIFGYDDKYVTQTSVTVWWKPEFDGGLPQTFFIQYRDDKSSWSNSSSLKDINENKMNFTVNGLKSGTQYYFTIIASNDLGSRKTKAISIRTKDTVMDPPPSTAGQVAGGVVGGALGILVITAVVIVFYKRRGIKIPTSDGKELVKRPSSDATTHVYQNVNLIQDSKTGKRLPPPPPPEIALDEINTQQNDGINDMDDQIYLNTQGLIDDFKKVTIPELLSYVKEKTVDDMQEEFDKFPKGMVETIPYKVARSPENVSLNRYQGIYPYDHSRVVISGKPDFFINANYINGFRRGKAYVASLGPTVKHTHGFITFWEMVWNEDTDVIVMLTNLQEPSGMKCEKYWAEKGTTRVIGDFTIQSVSEDVAAEYTVRTFTVFKNDESRLITQLHYTAWPDKKVPEDVTSLIEFRQRVKAAPTRSLGALVVHCRYYTVRALVEPEPTLLWTGL